MGEEPRLALMIKLIPTALMNRPMMNKMYLLDISFFDILLTFISSCKIRDFYSVVFIAKFQNHLSIKVKWIIFAAMNQQREFRKSEEPFYFVCYDKPTQKELYERNYKLIKVAEGGTITLSCCGEVLTAKEGDYLFVNRGGFSKIRIVPGKSGHFRLLCLNLTEKFLKAYAQTNLVPVCSSPVSFYFKKLGENTLLKALFSSLAVYADDAVRPDKRLVELKLEECLHLLTFTDKEIVSALFSDSLNIQKDLMEFMNANYTFNAPLEHFAEFSGRSLSTFRREFVQLFGTTPNKWLIAKRLEAAYRKLSEEHLKPSDIYWELGFETLAHFSRKFKEKYGMTPSELNLK